MYRPTPEISKSIDEEVLERKMHVEGVRIADEILITEHGYEGLTLIPKGKDKLDVIRHSTECHHGMDCSFRFDFFNLFPVHCRSTIIFPWPLTSFPLGFGIRVNSYITGQIDELYGECISFKLASVPI